MKIHEYQAKELLRPYGLPIPPGEVASTPDEAAAIAARLGGQVVVKAQVLVGGRGKAGGVKLADTPEEVRAKAAAILGMDIKENRVEKVLVTQAADIAREIYLGVVLDRATRRVALMASGEGGIDIEEVAATTPEKIIKVGADPLLGLQDFQMRQAAFALDLAGEQLRPFRAITRGLYQAFMDYDCSLAEINPLIVNTDGELQAIDAKINLDDNGLYRHSDLVELRDPQEETDSEREAREHGLSYVQLDGTIGCCVNGAGLAMATMDLVQVAGGQPANFLDIGGGAQADRVIAALRIILADERVQAVLFNIFGGITRCDEVARGIVAALPSLPRQVPLVVRLVGVNEAEGHQILREEGITAVTSMADAARAVVEAAR
ncbi:MAG: ADP-forming succinate--CoA ligase subunit beta [Dehalococcoidia bacterium]|nr:ADP-forming succinate--CoA ligase subunit beta [Dehalococcoidia bacterium]